MIKAAVVDDNPKDLKELETLLRGYADSHGENIQIQTFQDGEDIAEEYSAVWDVIFLDVEMRFLDGMKAAARIREMDGDVTIVFVTCNPAYAMQGYKVNAFDYLLKPPGRTELFSCMDRVLSRISRKKESYISVNIRGGVRKLNVARITYVEVIDHDLIYHTQDGICESKGTISEAEEALPSFCFSRCNRSFLVNLDHVSGIRGSDVIVGGELLQISRTRKKAFLDALNQYMNAE